MQLKNYNKLNLTTILKTFGLINLYLKIELISPINLNNCHKT